MKNWKSVLTTLAFLCLISEALAQFNQYTLLRRGQCSTYDSSVNIEIGEYRKIRLKLLTADSVYNQLIGEVFLAGQLTKSYIQQNFTKDEIIQRHEATIAAKDTTIAGLRLVAKDSQKLLKTLRISPDPWIDGSVKVGGGILIGILIRSLIRR